MIARALLARISERLRDEQDWTTAALEANLKAYAEEQGLGLGKLAQPLRAALTGQGLRVGASTVDQVAVASTAMAPATGPARVSGSSTWSATSPSP